MDSNIIYVKSYKEGSDVTEFLREVNRNPELSHFLATRLDAISIRDYIREYIAENGISSLFKFSLTCDALLHKGIHVDEITEIILQFIGKLDGVKDLYIIDPYLYSTKTSSIALLEKMISAISAKLETVTIFTNGKSIHKSSDMHLAIKKVSPNVQIQDVITEEFHDRFWIDPENSIGIVIGTSLDGIGKKIALIDHLQKNDACEVAKLAQKVIEETL